MKYPVKLSNLTRFTKRTAVAATLALCSVGIWATVKYKIAESLFSTSFLPHQFCFLQQPGLIWTNAVSDTLIWLSYVTISGGLFVLLSKSRKFLPFSWMFIAFVVFIIACGFTHFFELVTIWVPVYWLLASVKVLTAVASVATAIAIVPLVPRAAGAIRLFREAYSTSEKQRVETLSKLLDTEERMKLAVESAGVGTWDLNPVTNELHWDERCCLLFGVNKQQLVYDDFTSRIHPEDRAYVESCVNRALAENREYNARFRVVTDSSETRDVIARGKPFYDHEGHPIRFTGTIIDVTRERQAEEALLKSEKLAVAGRMAASIAHEINNPLDAAIGQLFIVRTSKNVPLEIKQRLEVVEDELNRAAAITRSTLTYYRESSHPVQTNPVEIVESILAFQQCKIRKADVEVQKHLVYGKPMYAFPGELRQILTNLISNAVEAMGHNGKLLIHVHPARDWHSGLKGYKIVVADTGPGIPKEHRKKLFDPFYTTKGQEGTGLGLWITCQLVQKHGGSIRYRSRCHLPEQTGGTVFSVWLPLANENPPLALDSGSPQTPITRMAS